jgi:hypothetical protein
MAIKYLSDEWINAVATEVAGNALVQALGSTHEFGLTQVVTATPFGEVTYNLQVGNGTVKFGGGAASPEHVRFTQSYETAVAVATAKLNAQEAFINGHIRFSGDHQRLIDGQDVFVQLDGVFTSVRLRTEYQ